MARLNSRRGGHEQATQLTKQGLVVHDVSFSTEEVCDRMDRPIGRTVYAVVEHDAHIGVSTPEAG